MLELIAVAWKVLKEPYKSARSLQAQNTLNYRMIIIAGFFSCRLQTSRCVSFRAPSGWSRFVAWTGHEKTSNMTEIWQKLAEVQEKLVVDINNGGKLRWPREILIIKFARKWNAHLAWGPLACCSRKHQRSQCFTGNQVTNGGEQRQMESISRQQHLDPGRPNSFQSLALNNVSNTSKKSVNLNVTSPFMSYAEVLNTNFRPTMVSTTSTPTPSTQTSPFYLLRDDARELTKLFSRLWFMLPWCLVTNRFIVLFQCSNSFRKQQQPFSKTWLRADLSKEQKSEGGIEFVFAAFAW